MKTKEFIKKVEELGYNVEISSNTVFIKYDGCILSRVDRQRPYTINTKAAFEVKQADELFDLCAKYAKTPIDERGDKKRYCLKKKNLEFFETYRYLTLNIKNNTFSLDVCAESANTTFKFTQEKIDWIKEKFNTDLEEFEQIEVEE